ncbi:MAG TPA: hypothetical protein VGQ09_04815 [Chitinophagaceae bacterium]|nr:hypothetical protein [Chitinophagaceae bacterium]
MKNIISSFLACFLLTTGYAQKIQSVNTPSEMYKSSEVPRSASVYGVFAGRTPCQEFMTELNMGIRTECTKRKMGVILYQDSVTHQPTAYKTWGMGKWTGQGKWHILRGTPTDPQAIIFQLDLDPSTSLFLLKGDDNVLFILDRNKNFLIGNADHSYTFNRVIN